MIDTTPSRTTGTFHQEETMNATLFCLSRPHYPYECSPEDLVTLEADSMFTGLTIHEPVSKEDGSAYIDLTAKVIKPVEYIHASFIIKRDGLP